MPEWITFIAATAFLLFVSRAALRAPRSHGFYRFFAWELMLVLFVMNMSGWYDAPDTPEQTLCGILMVLSLLLVTASYLALRRFGHADERRSDQALLVFEKTTRLVTRGIYRHIRHPMYNSLILLDWALFFKQMSWLHAAIAATASGLLVLAALAEERENIRYFGTPYLEYMQRSKRFIPFLA